MKPLGRLVTAEQAEATTIIGRNRRSQDTDPRTEFRPSDLRAENRNPGSQGSLDRGSAKRLVSAS